MNRLIKFLLCFFIVSSELVPIIQAEDNVRVDAPSALVVDEENGQILYEKNISEAHEIASLTKLLVIYLTYKAVDEGQLTLSDEVEISDKAYQISQDYNISNVPLRKDLLYSVEELIEAVGITLANGASIALAEKISGSEQAFLELMNEQLNDWGCTDYDLINITGLNEGYILHDADSIEQGRQNTANAETIATIAYHLVHDYPEILEFTAQNRVNFKVGKEDEPFEMVNYNLMLEEQTFEYDQINGLMVGVSAKDGYSLVTRTARNDLGVIGVVLGAKKDEKHYQAMKNILDYIYSSYRLESVITKGDKATQIGQIVTESGLPSQFHGHYLEDFNLVVPLIDTTPRLTYEFMPVEGIFNHQRLVPPLSTGEILGEVRVFIKDKSLPVLPSAKGTTVSIIVPEDIEGAPWYTRGWRQLTKGLDFGWNKFRKFFIELFN